MASEQRINIGWQVLLFVVFAAIYYCVSGATLWWAYDTDSFIRGEAYTRSVALVFTAKMALIISILTIPLWLLRSRSSTNSSPWRRAWKVVWKTGLVLIIYTAIVVTWRQFWTQAWGNNTAFLPIVGKVNGHFFSELLWLIFVFPVVPLVAFASGILYYLASRILDASGSYN